MSEFYVVGYRERRVIEKLTSGNYSRLCADILFGRSMGYYIIQVGQVQSPNSEPQVFESQIWTLVYSKSIDIDNFQVELFL